MVETFIPGKLWTRLNVSTLEMVRCVRPHLALAFKAPFLDPETIRRVRLQENTPIVNYYPDDPYIGVPLDPRRTSAQRRNLLEALRQYTKVFIWEKDLVNRLNSDGVCASYLPFGVDPESFRPLPAGSCGECRGRHEVVFVGLHNRRREVEMEAIRRHPVAIWGPGWGRAKRRSGGSHRVHHRRVLGKIARPYSPPPKFRSISSTAGISPDIT